MLRLPSLLSVATLVCGMQCVPATLIAADAKPVEGQAAVAPNVEVEVRKVWDQAKHQAFTDLVRFKDKWYLTFREGEGHVSNDGGLRVLTSTDGKEWTSASLVKMEDRDLRDPHLIVTPDGKLMLYGAAAIHKPRTPEHQTYVWFSEDGVNWSEPKAIGDKNYWLWRIVWHKGTAYGVGYVCNAKNPEDLAIRFYKSTDGVNFETVAPNMGVTSYPNESAILFDKDETAYVVLRRDGKNGVDGLLGSAKAPYTDWKWESLGIRLGGPQAIQLENGKIIVSGRKYEKGAQTSIWSLDIPTHSLKEIVTLPSGGDTSYPGLVWHDGKLWVSYYSSHEKKTNIYVAEVKLP